MATDQPRTSPEPTDAVPPHRDANGAIRPGQRLSLEEYHDLIRQGRLTDDDPVELLDGELVAKMPKKPPHSLATCLTRRALDGIVPVGWYVRAQEPITFGESEPEPDVTVVRGGPRQYPDHHPGPSDVALVVEVADTTLQSDRTTKKRLYAGAAMPVYWIVNLPQEQIEVYTGPSGAAAVPDYRQCLVYGTADAVPVTIGGFRIGELAVRDLLP
jgi:Uma2 family endonuclease